MKPVRRRIRRHFGLTAKQVAVRSRRPWYFQWSVSLLFVLGGYLIGYWQYAAGGQDLGKKLKQSVFDNQGLQTKLIQIERQFQIEQAALSNLEKELNLVHDENIHLKEDLLFYKNMLDAKKLPKR
jgi:hypothetical protein